MGNRTPDDGIKRHFPKKIRVSYVIDTMRMGGAERVLLYALQNIDKGRFDISLVTLHEVNDQIDQFKDTGVRLFPLRMSNRRDIRGLYRILSHFREFKPDIVHTHLCDADFLGRIAALMVGVPHIVSTEHSLEVWKSKPEKLRHRIRLALERRFIRRTDGIIAVSGQVASYLADNAVVEPDSVIIIPNGIPVDCYRLTAAERTLKAQGQEIVFGTVGRLCAVKGYGILLDAFKRLVGKHKDSRMRLLFAGDGPDMGALRAKADEYGLRDVVEFRGFTDTPSFLAEIDVFVLSSLIEGLPLALLEAMAAGRSVVATTVGGIPEVIRAGENGLLVKPGNPEELSEAMSEAVNDPDTIFAMGMRGRQVVIDDYSDKVMTDRLEMVYGGLCGGTTLKECLR